MSVGIQTDPIQRNERMWAQGLDAYQTTTGDTVDATFQEAIERSPTPSLARALRRQRFYPSLDEFGIEQPPIEEATILPAKKAQEEYGIPGELTFNQDIPEPVAEELHRQKREELQRRDVLNRSRGGFFQGAANLATGLAASVLDPLNVASAFIPVVGEARYALWAAQRGTTAARLAKGGIEGAVGAAVVEPIVYSVARSEQADYHAADSLLNIAFGTALGGGLHVGLGKLGDMIEARRAQEPMLRAAVAALAEGRPVDVESRLRADLLGNIYSRDLADLLPPEIRAARDISPKAFGPPEAAGPPIAGYALQRQVDAVRSQRDEAQAVLDRVSAEREKAASLADTVTKAETTRLETAIQEAGAATKAAREDVKRTRAEYDAANAEAQKAAGRLSVQVGGGLENRKSARLARQAAAAQEKVRAAGTRVDEAKARLEAAKARKAEHEAQLENYRANRARETKSTLDPLDAKLEAAKVAYARELESLKAAEKALDDYSSGRLAELHQAIEEQKARARDEFMNRAVAVARKAYEAHPEDTRAAAEIEAIAKRADKAVDTADAAKAGPEIEAEIVDITARLKAMGREAEVKAADQLTANADARAKGYEQAAVCEYMKVAAE